MNTIKNYKDFLNESSKSKGGVVKEYIDKYPEHEDFFAEFLDCFPTESAFKDALVDDIFQNEEDGEYEGLSDEELLDEHGSPETEVHVLKKELNSYPGDEIWVDFQNSLDGTGW